MLSLSCFLNFLNTVKYCTQLAIFVSDKIDHCLAPELNENIAPIIVILADIYIFLCDKYITIKITVGNKKATFSVCFECFLFLGTIVLISFYTLFYLTREFYRF